MSQPLEFGKLIENVEATFWKKGRLQTYKHWPFKSTDNKCNPENMAAAGFYAIGGADEPDLVECFMCGKQLDGWESDDDPWQEHKKHQSKCEFILLDKKEELSVTIKELAQLFKNYYKHKRHTEYEKVMEELKREWKETADNIPDIYEAMKKSQDV